MNSKSAIVQARINNRLLSALVDTGCDCYAAVDESVVKRLRLPLVDVRTKRLAGFSEAMGNQQSRGVAVFNMELNGYVERLYASVVPGLGQDIFLGKP